MSGVLLCTRKSDIPYKLQDTDMNIYSIEELAYYLYNNAYFVDDSFFTEELVDYIENTLGLKKVAQRLRYAMGQRIEFSELVMIIITGSMYYKEDEIRIFEKELKSIGSKSMLERMKARAQMLYENGKIASAKLVYENIIANSLYKKQNEEFCAQVRNGLGKIYCRMFYFGRAAEEFEQAYEKTASKKILRNLINAKLMDAKLKGEEADFSKCDYDKEVVELCKSEVAQLENGIRSSQEFEKINGILKYNGRRNLDDYYENVMQLLDKWKAEYRNDNL